MKSLLKGVVAASALAFAGASLAGDPVDNYQPSVAIRYSVINSGPMMGSIFMFAGNYDPFGTLPTNGGLLSISQNMELFTLIGDTFGGNGATFFQLPDLVGRTPIGSSWVNPVGTAVGSASYQITGAQLPVSSGGSGAPVQNMQPSLSVYAMIAATGASSSIPSAGAADLPYVGQVIYSAASPLSYDHRSNFDFLSADGNGTNTAEHGALFDTIGDTYGAPPDPGTFMLPDLSDRAAFGDGIGAALGAKSGSNEILLQPENIPVGGANGAPYSNEQAGLSMRYLICVDGIPVFSQGSPPPGDVDQGILGQIALYAGDGDIPDGWVLADGRLLNVAQNQLLFSIIGTSYGGNGATTFALPDLVNYVPIGSGGDIFVGEKFGTEFVSLTPSQVPEPGVCALVGLGLAGILWGRRPRSGKANS